MNNLRSNSVIKTLITPRIVTDNTPIVSEIIDTKGFNYLELATILGTLADADATFTVLVEHGAESNLSDNEAVPDAYLEGTEAEASFDFDADGEVRRIGYRPVKRYARLTITPAGNSGNAPIAAIGILYGAQYLPTTQTAS